MARRSALPPRAAHPHRPGRGLPVALLLAAALPATLGLAGCEGRRPPNVLLVVLDTARADAVSAYGAPGAATPNLDRLAAEGVLYTQARTVSAWTVPAHGSLFTGLYPSRHGTHHGNPVLAPDLSTVAELLAPTHATAGFSENPNIGAPQGFAQGFRHFEPTWRHQETAADVAPTGERALAWLASRDRSRPFFLFVNFMAPHLPYAPPPGHQERFLPPGVDPARVEWLRGMGEWGARQVMTGLIDLTDEDYRILRGLYRAEVSFADARVGELIAALAQEGELDRTLVAVVSDHGENLGDHGLMEHQFCLYETLLRVPLVLRLPGAFEGGERRDAPAQVVDLPPTILEVAGVPRKSWPPMEGVSLAGAGPAPGRPVLAEYMHPVKQRWRFERVNPDFDFDPLDRALSSVQVGELKLILSDRGEMELYDLAADPGETRDLAAERPRAARRLAAWLREFAQGARAPSGGGSLELDAETRDALRALGYLD